MIDKQLSELYSAMGGEPVDVDLSRRIAKLWEDRSSKSRTWRASMARSGFTRTPIRS